MGDYEVIPGEEKVLGEGCFGRVKKVRRKSDGQILACKSIRFREDDTTKTNVEREFEILKRLNHPNIVKFVDFVWRPHKAKLYMEYCNGGTLTDLIQGYKNSGTEIPETYIWSVVLQLASALAYCHHGLHENAAGVLYTPADWSLVLISRNPDTKDAIVKLGDFGLGRVLGEGTLASTYAGTPLYRPPEISYTDDSDIRWTEKCDVFSLGCTLYALCMLKPPFDRHKDAKSPTPRTIPEVYSEHLRRSITACLSFKPEQRHDILDILKISKRHAKENIHIGVVPNTRSCETPEDSNQESAVQENSPQKDSIQGISIKDDSVHDSIVGYAKAATNTVSTSEKMTFEDLTPPGNPESRDTNFRVHSGESLSRAYSEAFSGYGSPHSMQMLYKNLVDRYWNDSRFHDLRKTCLKIPEHMNFDQFNESFGEMNELWLPDSTNSSKETLLDLHPGYGYSIMSSDARLLGRIHCLGILMGDAKIIQFLLEEGVDVHFQDQLRLSGYGSSPPSQNVTFADPPLMLAALTKNKMILEMLVKAGADVNRSDPETGRTALHHAAYEGDTKILELLLDSGADIELGDNEGRTPLHCATYGVREEIGACQTANLPAMTLFIDRGANLEARTKDGFTPLHTAVYTYQEKPTQLLLERGASLHAKTKEDKSVLDFLFVRYIKPKTGIDQFSVFALLLKHGAFDDNREGRTRLQNAVIFQKAAYVKLILEWLLGPNVPTPMRQHVDSRDLLGRTALHYAAMGIRADILQYLIEAGADVNAQDNKVRRPVHHAAARFERLDCLKVLVLAGADINAKGKSSVAALHLVAQWDTKQLLYIWEDGDNDEKELEVTEALDFILKAGADVHARTTTGANAVCLAAKKGNTEILEGLLKAGTPPSKRDLVRKSTLHWAKTDRGPPAAELVDLYKDESVSKGESTLPLYWRALLAVTLVALCLFFGFNAIQVFRPRKLEANFE